MTDRAPRTGAIVLAGGRSSRFGGDKLAVRVDGRALLDRAIDAVRVVTSEVVVVAPPGVDRLVPDGVRVAHDERPFDGPLAGLAAGLAALEPDVERAIVVAGDMPSLVPAVLARLIAALAAAPTVGVAVLGSDGEAPPLPMAVDVRRATAAIATLRDGDERRLRALIEALETQVVPAAAWRMDDPLGITLLDIDVPADLDTRRPPTEERGSSG
jgi:molybdopterin-guanine dinucleotide biosynthesis protein A